MAYIETVHVFHNTELPKSRTELPTKIGRAPEDFNPRTDIHLLKIMEEGFSLPGPLVKSISRNHCTIFNRGRELFVIDTSAAGTEILLPSGNWQRIEGGKHFKIKQGDRLRLSQTWIIWIEKVDGVPDAIPNSQKGFIQRFLRI